MFRFTAIFCVILVSFSVNAQDVNYSLRTNSQINYNELEAGFRQPPPQSRLRCYWWWLNSYTTKETITRDLKEMKAKGYGGATLVDAGSSSYDIARKTKSGPRYLSPAWMELYKYAVKEADRLGIELSVNLGSGWNPGGPSITPENAMKKLVYADTIVSGGGILNIRLPEPEKNLLYKDVMVQAIREKEGTPLKDSVIENWSIKSFNRSIGWKGIYPLYKLREDFPGSGEEIAVQKNETVDLTDNYENGELNWDAPAGRWTIIRYGYTCTGARTSTSSDGWHGLSVDHLSAKAFQVFADSVVLPLIKTAQSAGNSVKYLLTDSWEMGVVNWTDDFPSEFKKYRGYDIHPYMPVLAGRIVESREVSDRFLHDLRRTVSDLVADKHYQLLYDLAHQYGLGIHPESGGPHSAPIDALEIMAIGD
ncbi:MAG TPA: glycosyl hydrolase, partial [Bacteroidales bacterium]|nr:glycosyl hydrolase [Bacteroidales bacterium]